MSGRTRGARLLPEVSYTDLRKLAAAGAQVVHPEAARLAERHRVSLRVYGFDASVEGDPGGTTVLEPRLDLASGAA